MSNLAETKLVDGKRVNLKTAVKTAINAEWATRDAAQLAAKPMKDWEAEIAAIDAEGMPRHTEIIIDSLIAAGIAITDSVLLDRHTRKKAKRAQRP